MSVTGNALEPGSDAEVRVRRNPRNPISVEEILKKRRRAAKSYRQKINTQTINDGAIATPKYEGDSIYAYNFSISNGVPEEYFGTYDRYEDKGYTITSDPSNEVRNLHEIADEKMAEESCISSSQSSSIRGGDDEMWSEMSKRYEHGDTRNLEPYGTISFDFWYRTDPDDESIRGVPVDYSIQSGNNIDQWNSGWKITEGEVQNDWRGVDELSEVFPNKEELEGGDSVSGSYDETISESISINVGSMNFNWTYSQKASTVVDESNTHIYDNAKHRMDVAYKSNNSRTRAGMTPGSIVNGVYPDQELGILTMKAKWAKGLDDWNPWNDGNQEHELQFELKHDMWRDFP
jgi:hypothetical protein